MENILIDLNSVKIGADPELFLFDVQENKFKSSIGLIGGSKECPRQLERGIAVQEDNVLVEFNIPPAANKTEFIKFIQDGLFQIKNTCIVFPNLDLKVKSSAFMSVEELCHPKAEEFGCTPDFNAWKRGRKNERPGVPTDGLRSAGGHIHIGFEPTEMMQSMGLSPREFNVELIKLCDLYLGVPSIVMDRDQHRRKLYGKAGAFRPKSYGVEYRTLSSFWLQDVAHIDWAYEQTMRAVKAAASAEFVPNDVGEAVERVINTAALSEAEAIVASENLELVA